MELFHICAIQHGGHQTQVATEHLRCSQCTWETEFKILLNINLNCSSHIWWVVTLQYKAALESHIQMEETVTSILIIWVISTNMK